TSRLITRKWSTFSDANRSGAGAAVPRPLNAIGKYRTGLPAMNQYLVIYEPAEDGGAVAVGEALPEPRNFAGYVAA
ncbi:MAG: hypothetical protein WCK40_09980, partial [Thermoleophilia bacterium]